MQKQGKDSIKYLVKSTMNLNPDPWWEKNGHFGKVIAGKFIHLEGNSDFRDKEIHKK